MTESNNGNGSSNSKLFSKTCVSFAIDVSGSTAGNVLNVERNFITTAASKLDNALQANVIPWNHSAFPPTQLSYLPYLASTGGTSPSVLLTPRSPQLATLKQADLWFLLTDGQIGTYEVQRFGTAISAQGLHGSPCVIVVFGHLGRSPVQCDISVGFAPFATSPNCLFLYRDVRSRSEDEVYLLQAKGCFESLIPGDASQPEITEATTWGDLPKLEIRSALSDMLVAEKQELAAEEVNLGEGVTVDTNDLYSSNAPVSDDYLMRILGNQRQQQSLAHTSHARGNPNQLRGWLVSQQQAPPPMPMGQPYLPPDVAIQQIVGAIRASRPRSEYSGLQQQVRTSHNQYQEVSRHQRREHVIQQTLSRIDNASKYSADSLSAADSTTELHEGEVTDPKSAFRSECPICCQTDVAMSLLIIDDGSAPPPQLKTWHYPFAAGAVPQMFSLVSSFLICEQCAPHLKQSPHGEKIATSIPLVNYRRNRNFWKARLAKAGFLGRNVPESQREAAFISALDTVLKTKEWARPPNTPYNTPWLQPQAQSAPADPTDNTMRYNALCFAIQTLIENIQVPPDLNFSIGPTSPSRSTKKMAPPYSPLKSALERIIPGAADIPQTSRFHRNTSVLVHGHIHNELLYRYPVNGFNLLLKIAAYHNLLPLPSSAVANEQLQTMLLVKTVHHVTGRFMDVVTNKGIDAARAAPPQLTWESSQQFLTTVLEKGLMSHTGIELLRDWASNPALSSETFTSTMNQVFERLGLATPSMLKATVPETVHCLCLEQEKIGRWGLQFREV